MKYIIYKTIKTLGRPIYKLLFFPRYYGVNNIPKEGAVILAGNHTSNLDAAMMVGSPNRVVHMIAKKELFNTKLKNWFFRSMACIPVDRSIHDEKCKNEAIEYLERGEAIGLFPEGTVNKTKGTEHEEYLLPFKFGAVSLAKKENALIIPFATTGLYNGEKEQLITRIGKPLDISGMELEDANKLLRETMIKLMQKSE